MSPRFKKVALSVAGAVGGLALVGHVDTDRHEAKLVKTWTSDCGSVFPAGTQYAIGHIESMRTCAWIADDLNSVRVREHTGTCWDHFQYGCIGGAP